MKNLKQILIPTITLFLVCAIVAAALAITNFVTKDTIEKSESDALQQSLQSAAPDAQSFDSFEIDKSSCYKAMKDGEIIAYVFETSAKGYGGDITVLTSVSDEGKILKVIVSDASNETTGIGTKVTTDTDFTEQFEGASGALSVGADIDAVTGATYSSRGVTNAVNKALELYEKMSEKEEAGNE